MGLRNPVEIQMQVLALCLLKQKLKKDEINIAKVSVYKLSRIGINQAKLRKSVLINNILKDLQNKGREDSVTDHQGRYRFTQIAETVLKSIGSTTEHFEKNTERLNGHINTSKEDRDTFGEDKLSLCDDIINEFLDISDSKDNKGPPDVHKLGCHQTSPYSYNSFLSELDQVQNIY